MPALPGGRPYFVMELVRGIRITDYCDQANLSTQERLDLFIKVCHAIQHAHQKGIIRSDIYSLGVLLYELLAGSTPFDAKELMASGIDVMRKTIREKEPQRPSTRLATLGADQLTTTAKRRSADTSKLLHQLKGDLDWIVMKCLEKDRQRRYDTANGLAADLKRHLDNEPVVARPPRAACKFQKACRRKGTATRLGPRRRSR